MSALFFASACGASRTPVEECQASCTGCCDTDGTCRPGTDTFRCGASGNACNQCVGNAICAFGICANPSAGSGGGHGSTGGGSGSTGGGVGATGGGFGSTGGGFGSTGGGIGSTGGGVGSTGGGTASTGGGSGGGTGSTGSAPVITAMSIGSEAIYPTGFAQISVSATDADGLGDLSGGTLALTSTGEVISSFSGSAGLYTTNLSWTMLQSKMDITFVQSMTIDVTATIYDQASHVATRTLTVTLACNSGVSAIACSGVCSDINSLETCGGCGNDCNARFSGEWNTTCTNGTCFGSFRDETTTPRSCNSVCAGHSATCMAIPNDSVGNGIYNDQCASYVSTCTQLPPTSNSCGALNAVNCTCT